MGFDVALVVECSTFTMTTALLIGDSIRLHYQDHVARLLRPAGIDVAGPAVNCGTSQHILAHIDAWLAESGPDIVHLNCGLHDLRRDPTSDAPEVALDAYSANLDAIVCRITASGARVAWASSTPIDEARHNATRFSRRYARDVTAYNEAARSIAERRGLPVNDLGVVVEAAGAGVLLGTDGVHLTPRGYQELGEAVAAFLRPRLPGRPAVFLDLGGTLGDQGAEGIHGFALYPVATEAIRLLSAAGYLTIVVTNQSRIARGQFDTAAFDAFVAALQVELARNGASIDGVYICPHASGSGCGCRKPEPGLLMRAADDHRIQLRASTLVGDVGAWDVVAARRAGCRAVLVRTGWGEGSLNEYRGLWGDHEADHVAADVLGAARWIVGERAAG